MFGKVKGSKIRIILMLYGISGIPVGFKGYSGVLIHLTLYLTINALDWAFWYYLGLNVSILSSLHYLIYAEKRLFILLFNPVLYLYEPLALVYSLSFIALALSRKPSPRSPRRSCI